VDASTPRGLPDTTFETPTGGLMPVRRGWFALSPINRRRWQNFKANRRGYWSFWLFIVLFMISLFAEFIPDVDPYRGTTEQALKGNAISHQGDGQNVLFLDSHVGFEKRSFCSLEDDNIYTISANTVKGDAKGTVPDTSTGPRNRKDSLLVHDPDTFGNTRSRAR